MQQSVIVGKQVTATNMKFIRLACYCWALHIAGTFDIIPKIRCIMNQRVKRNTEDNFSVLLNLYKMNPLRDSKVFEMFSNNILPPNRASGQGIDALHFDENESNREKQMRAEVNLKRIQDMIHASPSHSRRISRPEFLVDSTVAEKFSSELTLKNIAKSNLFKPKQDAFQDIFGHIIESNEIVDSIPDTNRLVNDRIPVAVSPADFNNLEYNNDFKVKSLDEGIVIMR